jgi:hypothetical protein
MPASRGKDVLSKQALGRPLARLTAVLTHEQHPAEAVTVCAGPYLHPDRGPPRLPVHQGLSMGRLFWKLFLILWLAQICTVVGVGAVFWIKHRNETAAAIERHPMDGAVLDLAASLLRHEGSAGLRSSWKA